MESDEMERLRGVKMTIRIESYNADNGDHVVTMHKSIVDYTEWLQRAIKREYKIGSMGEKVCIFGGRGKRYFIVDEV